MEHPPRLRVFAGPNGSGKSIMKQQVMRTVVDGRPVNLGVYVNADEIAAQLRKTRRLDLKDFKVAADRTSFRTFTARSGLLNRRFPRHRMLIEHRFVGTEFRLIRTRHLEHFAQLLAAYLCEQHGHPIEAESNTAMPASFLMQQMQWREALDEARGGDRAAAQALAREVEERRDGVLARVARALDERNDYAEAAAGVRELHFIDRFRDELAAYLAGDEAGLQEH